MLYDAMWKEVTQAFPGLTNPHTYNNDNGNMCKSTTSMLDGLQIAAGIEDESTDGFAGVVGAGALPPLFFQ